MSECPDIDQLLQKSGGVGEHVHGCEACSAVLALEEFRHERAAGREEACEEAEIRLALDAEGLLEPEQRALLSAHLESCAECGEVAVRLAWDARAAGIREVSAPSNTQALGGSTGRRPRARLVVLFAASMAMAAAVGALVARSGLRQPAELPTPEALGGPPIERASRPGLGPWTLPTPSVERPTDDSQKRAPSAAPIGPRAVRGAEPERPTLVNPWASDRATPTPAPSPAPLPVPAKPAPAQQGTGYLTVICVPVCESVIAGGKTLGSSPVVRAPVQAGRLKLTLESGAVRKRIDVTIVAGQVVARRINMAPPRKDSVVDPWQ
ncbi:MAG: zf-HC2 domain-containing protein [Myxococcales bacterium]|nr:zf-HC2 domain-containing protein [Myxococcales bacterium]